MSQLEILSKMSRKQEATFKNLGIGKELLFEKIKDVILSIDNALSHVNETVDAVSEEHRVDPFDFECMRDNAMLGEKALTSLKNSLVCLFRIDGDVYEDLLYSIVKAINCLGNRTRSLITSHNAFVCFYSKQEIIEVNPTHDTPDGTTGVTLVYTEVPAPRRRGRPSAKNKVSVVKKVEVAPVEPRVILDATTIDVEIEEIKINILARVVHKPLVDTMCEVCQVKMEPLQEEPNVLKCGGCGGIEYQEEVITEEGNTGGTTETKRKPGNDVKFSELINSIQGKLVIEPKFEEIVHECISEARRHFNCGVDSYDQLDTWLRCCRDGKNDNKKKYNKIYKHCPYIYSQVSGFELASITDSEYAMISAAYDIIYSNYRETNCKNVSGESTNSIKAEFYIEKLIDCYVKDSKRANALKKVIPTRTDKSNSSHTIVWNHINSLGLLK